MNSNPLYIITHTEYDNSNALFRNSENEEIFHQNFAIQGIFYVIILLDSTGINCTKLDEQIK